MVGMPEDFQNRGIRALAVLSKCLESEFLYFLIVKRVTWRRQPTASNFNNVSVIWNINSLPLDQKGCIPGQCHHMCSKVPFSLWQRQQVSGVCGNQEWSFTGMAYQRVSNLYAVSWVLVLSEHLWASMKAVCHCFSETEKPSSSDQRSLSPLSLDALLSWIQLYAIDVALSNSSPFRHTVYSSVSCLLKFTFLTVWLR